MDDSDDSDNEGRSKGTIKKFKMITWISHIIVLQLTWKQDQTHIGRDTTLN